MATSAARLNRVSGGTEKNRIGIALAVVLTATIAAGYFITHTFSALLTSLVLAYLLNPLLKYLERRGFDRFTALLLLYGVGALAVLFSSFLLIPYIGHQIDALAKSLPIYLQIFQAWLEHWKIVLGDYYGGDEGIWLIGRIEASLSEWGSWLPISA